MHDIDRTMAELEAEDDTDVLGGAESGLELEDEDAWQELEDEDEYEDEGEGEDEDDDDDEYEYGDEVVLPDEEELELAAELLDVADEEELEQFLGKLFRRAKRRLKRFGRRARRFFKKGVGRRLGRVLKKVVKRALPIAGAATGAAFGGPVGLKVGGNVGRIAGGMFELELEGLPPEEQELEAARRVVRLATSAMSNAARGSQTSASPQRIVRTAMMKAARRHAPGLLRPARTPSPALRRPGRRKGVDKAGGSTASGSKTTGRWVRRGNSIVLLGV